MGTLIFALVGGIGLLYLLGHDLSIAGAVGFIALVGVSAGFGMFMLLQLKQARDHQVDEGRSTLRSCRLSHECRSDTHDPQ